MTELIRYKSDWLRYINVLFNDRSLCRNEPPIWCGGDPDGYPCIVSEKVYIDSKNSVHIFGSFFYVSDAMDLIQAKINGG